MNIGITEENREKTAEIVNKILADEYVLYLKAQKYHWNVVGPQFNDLHKFFEEQYGKLQEIVDDVAERVRMLGVNTKATFKEFLEMTSLQEDAGSYPNATDMVKNLLADHEAVTRNIREAIPQVGDVGTEDFLTGLLQEHEKMAWMLRAMTQ